MKRQLILSTTAIVVALAGCGQQPDRISKDSNSQMITKPAEHINPTKDQLERRAKSEAFCATKNIPVYQNQNSLFLDPEEKVTVRTKDEVVDRAIALCYLELKSEKADKKMLGQFEKKYNVLAKLTPKEKQFALAENPTEQQMTNANWRAESFHVMLWVLGYIENLKYPNEVCVVADDVTNLFSKTEEEFRASAKLRTKKEILNEADLILRLDWACVEARVKKEIAPGGLDSSVVYERHYSFNWLIKLMNNDWDQVTTDT